MNEIDPGASSFLTPMDWPKGLQRTIVESCKASPLRFFILDDSGSMCCNDGHQLLGRGASQKIVGCSRWSELGQSVKFHAGFAHAAGIPTEFRLLNATNPLVIGQRDFSGQSEANLSMILRALDRGPNGGTPLCHHIRAVIDEISIAAPQLRANNQTAVVVIITDGEASDGNMIDAMRPLKSLPVHVVVRICTDDDQVVKYWNNIDSELELAMDILDDFEGEAREIHEHNPWLVYGEPLHRLREWGITLKEFDLLDESKLSSEQMRAVISFIHFGGNPAELPHPDIDWNHFKAFIQSSQSGKIWNPLHLKMEPWINLSKLQSMYGPPSGCSIS